MEWRHAPPHSQPIRANARTTGPSAVTIPDRTRVRSGMITHDGPVVRAFARIGWEWGGSWNYSKDYMHFIQNGL